MNWYGRLVGWLGLGDCDHVEDALFEEARASEEALRAEERAHRATRLELVRERRAHEGCRREVAALRRLHLAYQVVLDAQARKRLDGLVASIEQTFGVGKEAA